MSLVEAVETRHSCRKFQQKQIPKEILEKLVAIAQNSPTGCDYQSYDFIVVTNPEVLDQVSEKVFASIPEPFKQSKPNANKSMVFYGAPAVIFICPARPFEKNCYLYDLGIVANSICIGAKTEGISSTVIGFVQRCPGSELKPILGLPTDQSPIGIALGYPAEDWEAKPREYKSKITYIE